MKCGTKVKKMNTGGATKATSKAKPKGYLFGGMVAAPTTSGSSPSAMPSWARSASSPSSAGRANMGNAGGATRGLARAAAMSGRAMPTPGRPAPMKKGGKAKAKK